MNAVGSIRRPWLTYRQSLHDPSCKVYRNGFQPCRASKKSAKTRTVPVPILLNRRVEKGRETK